MVIETLEVKLIETVEVRVAEGAVGVAKVEDALISAVEEWGGHETSK